MAWNETAWQHHLKLARVATRYSSNSYDQYRVYWLFDGFVVIMNENGECRETGITDAEARRLMFSHNLETDLHTALFNRGTLWLFKD